MYASFPVRFKAFMLDYILILGYLISLLLINLFVFPSLQDLFTESLLKAQFFGFLMVTLPISLYFIHSDSKMGKQTFGKRKSGIKVINENGEAPKLSRLVYRTIMKFLPWEMSHFLVYRLIYIEGEVPLMYTVLGGVIYALIFSYILTAIFTKKKQSLYDIVAKTYVVKV